MTTTTTITITGYSTNLYNADASNTDYVFTASALRKVSSGYGISLTGSGDILTNSGYVRGFGGITVGANDTVVNALEIKGESNPTGHPNASQIAVPCSASNAFALRTATPSATEAHPPTALRRASRAIITPSTIIATPPQTKCTTARN